MNSINPTITVISKRAFFELHLIELLKLIMGFGSTPSMLELSLLLAKSRIICVNFRKLRVNIIV